METRSNIAEEALLISEKIESFTKFGISLTAGAILLLANFLNNLMSAPKFKDDSATINLVLYLMDAGIGLLLGLFALLAKDTIKREKWLKTRGVTSTTDASRRLKWVWVPVSLFIFVAYLLVSYRLIFSR